MPKKRAKEIVKTHPGAYKRREALILALLQGGVGAVSHYATQPDVYAKFVVGVANKIIEETEG